jgi:hypothetical protein
MRGTIAGIDQLGALLPRDGKNGLDLDDLIGRGRLIVRIRQYVAGDGN